MFILHYYSAKNDGAVYAVSVCPSDKSLCSVKAAKQIDLDFGTEAIFCLSYTVLYRNFGIFKNKGTFLWNFVPNSGL